MDGYRSLPPSIPPSLPPCLPPSYSAISAQVVGDVVDVGKLLTQGIIDPDDEIRENVFMSLAMDERFDAHLAQADSLTTLFVALHDKVSKLLALFSTHVEFKSYMRLFAAFVSGYTQSCDSTHFYLVLTCPSSSLHKCSLVRSYLHTSISIAGVSHL